MRSFAKIAACFVIFLAVYLFTFWVAFAQFLAPGVAQVASIFAAVVAAWWTWRATGADNRGAFATSAHWALIVGGIGFCGGFFGPLIFDPGANQGPLFGIFITGPLGFIAGGLFGLLYALSRRPKDNLAS